VSVEIEINGSWLACELLYPYQEEPVAITGPGGSQHWQARTEFNALLKLPFPGLVLASEPYSILVEGKLLKFTPVRPTQSNWLGNIL
jgi:hypothetical protein